MRKIFCVLLTVALAASVCACGQSGEKAAAVCSALPPDNVLAEADPLYDRVRPMMRALEAFAEYDRLMNGSLDYSALSEDDFWNIIALAVSSLEDGCDIASVDIAGFYHIKWKCAEDIAKTFMYEHWKRNFMPNYSGSYAASADPGSGIIDLAPLSVDNYEGKLEYIEKASEASDCDYIIHITLCGRVDSSDVYSYEIRLAEWSRYIESEEEHIFPFMVVGMSASRSGSAESAEASPQQGAQDMK